ncbi:hypothetical protein AAK899_01975 [Erysipelotrichaceae bacterium 51-3]
MTCLFLMGWILFLMNHAADLHQDFSTGEDRELSLTPGWIVPFWMIPAGWLIETQVASSQILLALFWFGLAIFVCMQDLKTFYFSYRWLSVFGLVMVAGFFQPLSLASRLGAMTFGAAGIVGWRLGKMGSADVLALLAMGMYLGFERMLAALLVACLSALGYAWASQTSMVPFLSFLAYGFILAMFKGYTLIEFFYSLARL